MTRVRELYAFYHFFLTAPMPVAFRAAAADNGHCWSHVVGMAGG